MSRDSPLPDTMEQIPAVHPVIRIPDTLINWPWPRIISPYYEQCKAESTAWFEGFKAFSPRAQKAFNRCDFSKWLYMDDNGTRRQQKRLTCPA